MTHLRSIIITPLTTTERLVLEQISFGYGPGVGSASLTMARATFNRHSAQIGHKLQVRGAPVKVQMGFVCGELPLPEARLVPTEFDEKERLLWQAHALHSTAAEIARHAKIYQFDLAGDTACLVSKAGANAEAHLIRLGHAYGILSTDDVPAPCSA
ncbi:hypothetical protein [Streptomyces sp. NPDC001948]